MTRRRWLVVAAALALAACSGGDDITFDPSTPTAVLPEATGQATQTSPTYVTQPSSTITEEPGVIAIDTTAAGAPFHRELLGTNVPAWLGGPRLADAEFQELTRDSGATMLRMPGGSWSTAYDWLGCENGDTSTCVFTEPARPTDFIELMEATGLAGMWTTSFNDTAQQSAALVAFFNGAVGDERPIGVDRNGQDWGTVGQWAALRASHGNPDPRPITYWEIGNEVFGARREAGGPDCPEFGWEDVWTCKGGPYVDGDDGHDGFLAHREAMQAVDPSIQVGAVGLLDPTSWGNWGNDVLGALRGQADFYIVHDYGFFDPASDHDVLVRPQQAWGPLTDMVRSSLDDHGFDGPIAVTEYNLYVSIDRDQSAQMVQAINALFLADTIGQLATHGYGVANQWNLANGAADNGTDYGLFDAETLRRYPAYYAMALWSRFGDTLLPAASGFDAESELAVYASSGPDGSYHVLAVNKSSEPTEATIRLAGASGSFDVTADVAAATSLDAREMSYNDMQDPPTDLDRVPSLPAGSTSGEMQYTFPGTSVTVLHFVPGG